MYPINEETYVGSDNVRQRKPSTIIYIKRKKIKDPRVNRLPPKKKKGNG
jgi:hypothetical protein